MSAEFGVDMSRFGAAEWLAPSAGLCPGQHGSAGRIKTCKASKWLRRHLNEAAKSIIRSKGNHLSTQYSRMKARRGYAKATGAAEHSIIVAAFHSLYRGEPYHDLGADYFVRRHESERHARQLQPSGYDVTTRSTGETA